MLMARAVATSLAPTCQRGLEYPWVPPTGLTPAIMLSTGEVIPAAILFTRNGNTLTLTWPSGWFLQSATDVTGPYSDVEAISPYPVSMIAPQQFFRLRQ